MLKWLSEEKTTGKRRYFLMIRSRRNYMRKQKRSVIWVTERQKYILVICHLLYYNRYFYLIVETSAFILYPRIWTSFLVEFSPVAEGMKTPRQSWCFVIFFPLGDQLKVSGIDRIMLVVGLETGTSCNISKYTVEVNISFIRYLHTWNVFAFMEDD